MRILMVTVLKLWTAFGRMDIFTLLILSIHNCGRSFYLLASSSISLLAFWSFLYTSGNSGWAWGGECYTGPVSSGQAGQLHRGTHSQCDSMHKKCASPSQTNSQHGKGNWAQSPMPSQGALGNCYLLQSGPSSVGLLREISSVYLAWFCHHKVLMFCILIRLIRKKKEDPIFMNGFSSSPRSLSKLKLPLFPILAVCLHFKPDCV